MKKGQILLLVIILALIGTIVTDVVYISKLKKRFMVLEKQRIITSNKLATAKIVHENLNHVRELVFKNMDFPGQTDSVSHETHFFDFVTTCVNDLKLKLVSVRPSRPKVDGRITTYKYEIKVEGDFFNFGELCSKFENSRRIVTLQEYAVALMDKGEKRLGGPERKRISIRMFLDTYRVKKSPEIESASPGSG
ncbi:MAG: type 4a pilus biogenesis protein PilO [Chitinivibrionales bacterium]|nr:type 4a pilus biogenesis protein PilO [Chitinivibrionales bacterium]MBD3395729.1 type 4a pilus biogenesis protein PilO [Chitinivibrionales bacterium]